MLNWEKIDAILDLLNSGHGVREAARQAGVCRETVKKIASGKIQNNLSRRELSAGEREAYLVHDPERGQVAEWRGRHRMVMALDARRRQPRKQLDNLYVRFNGSFKDSGQLWWELKRRLGLIDRSELELL